MRPLLHALLRWVLAAALAAVVAGGLFLAMALLVNGSGLIEKLIRVFPLTAKQLTPEERCELASLPTSPAVTIEGTVGYLADGRFVPLDDAEVGGDPGVIAGRGVTVDADGHFRFATALPSGARTEAGDLPAACAGQSRETPHLVIRAPGCRERRVPLTEAWVPHRILLSCPERG